jgi:DNA-binding Xre family transcriptional regulator
MNIQQLRKRLETANLTRLARATEIDIRTLRRIKHGRTQNVLLRTMETLEKHLQPPTPKGKK